MLREQLAPLSPSRFELADDSHLHAGHAGARETATTALLLVSEAFHGRTRLPGTARYSLVRRPDADNAFIARHQGFAPEEV